MIGIYKITNKINGMVYIGESLDIERRWAEHKADLDSNKHHSRKLQKDWNKYGEDNFIFEVIEELNQEYSSSLKKLISLALEDRYIKQYDSIENGYNVEHTLYKILKGEKGVFRDNVINKVHINMLKNVVKNIQINNGVYISKNKSKTKKNKNNDISVVKNTNKPKVIKDKIKNASPYLIEYKNVIGIYQIKNIATNKILISSSTKIYQRVNETFKKLNENRYENQEFQSEFNTYGKDNFTVSVLETLDTADDLEEKKLEYIFQFWQTDELYNSISKKSIKQFEIIKDLKNKNIKYIMNYKTDECKMKSPVNIDFALLDNKNNIYKIIVFNYINNEIYPRNNEQYELSLKAKIKYAKNNNLDIEIIDMIAC
jgi:group I intron endonuclease